MYYLTTLLMIAIPVIEVFAKNKWKDTDWTGRTTMVY